jgi:DNA-directed RNA polymerase specialized sigma24 family protein
VPESAELAGEDFLLDGIRVGDQMIFARWLSLVEGRLRDSLRPFAARVDVEAVLQESLVRVWQVAPRFVPDGRPEALLRLAIRIARNLAISELRRNRIDLVDPEFLERALADAEQLSTRPNRGSDPILRRAIEECRRKLPRRPAEAIQARIDSGGAEPDAVLADRLQMRRNTFLQNITRARRLLAACLRRRGIDVAGELA